MIKEFSKKTSLKDKRIKQLYSLIYEQGPISKNELIESTDLTSTTCSRLIDELIEESLIIESGFGESSGGRKPLLYEVKADAYYVFGVDISRTYTKVLLMDFKLNVKTEVRLKMDKTSTPEVTIHFLETEIKKMTETHQLKKREILGIGIGAIGPLDRESGVLLNPFRFPSPGWENIPIRDILQERLGIEVLIDYGVNTALLAEYNHSYKKLYDNVIYMVKGVGSRTGIIIDGRLKHGTDKLGLHGQGHMIVDIHGRKCYCGSYGCVQAYSSIRAMTIDVINALKQGKKSILTEWLPDIENVQFEDICQAVNEGDSLCCDIVKNAAYYTGMGISNLINVLHPDLIILSGPTYINMNLFYDTVVKVASERSKTIFPNHKLHFSHGELGENAIAIGAGGILVSHYLS